MPAFDRWFLQRAALAVVLTAGVATFATATLSHVTTAGALPAVAFWAASYAAWALLGARLQGLFRFKRYAVACIVFVVVALLQLAAPIGRGITAAMFCLASANFAAAMSCGIDFLSRGASKVEAIDDRKAGLIRSYAANAWLTSIAASFVWSRGEIAIVQGNLGESAVGLYGVGLTISGAITQGVGLLTGGLWPQIASAWDNGERDRVLKLTDVVTNVLMLAAGLSASFVICFAPYIITFLFGKAFLSSSGLVMILALGPLALAAGCPQLVLQAATNGRFPRNITLIGGIAIIGAAVVLVPRVGLAGVAMARAGIQLAMAAVTLLWLARTAGHAATHLNLRSFLALVVTGIGLVMLLTIRPELHVAGRLSLFAFAAGLVCLVCVPIRDRVALRQLRGILSGVHA